MKSTSYSTASIPKTAQGYTLIELLVIIVVLATVVGALLGIFTTSVGRSADPMLRMQAIAIAQGYLEEALLKAYQDPDDPSAEPGCEEVGRAAYDDVQDYVCIVNESPVDYLGNTLAGLGSYIVNVTVTPDSIGSGLQQANTQRVDVTVTHASQPLTVTLSGHRAQYN